MHLFNFKKEFESKLLEGWKNTTIRKPRKRPVNKGNYIRIYTGLRTRNTRFLGDSLVLKKINIQIHTRRKIVPVSEPTLITPIGYPLTKEELVLLSKRDGFDEMNRFFEFFEKGDSLPALFDLFFYEPLNIPEVGFKKIIIWGE